MQTIVTLFLLIAGCTLGVQFLSFLIYCHQKDAHAPEKQGSPLGNLATAE